MGMMLISTKMHHTHKSGCPKTDGLYLLSLWIRIKYCDFVYSKLLVTPLLFQQVES